MVQQFNNSSSAKTIIIGGGVIGLSIAWELARRGQLSIILEAGQIGRGASWAGAGILPPAVKQSTQDPYELLRTMSHDLHRQWAQELRKQTNIDTGYRRCGGIYLARSLGELATLTASQSWWIEHGIEHLRWSPTELLQREPELASIAETGLRAAWFLPDEYQLRNPRHLQALAVACQQAGVEVFESASVTRFQFNGEKVLGVETTRGSFTTEQICICSGAWARQMLEQLGLASGIMPVRGQMVLYNCGRPPLSSIINEGHRYLVPREDGRLLAGSVEEEAGYVIETTEQAITQIREWAEDLLPVLKTSPVEQSWAGLRPGSFDGFPYLGRVPGTTNLFMAAGHFRSGLHLSCATAVILANEMQGITNAIDLRSFRVGRG